MATWTREELVEQFPLGSLYKMVNHEQVALDEVEWNELIDLTVGQDKPEVVEGE